MKFNLYGAKFETSGHAIFKLIDSVSLDRLMITSEESIPTGCSINWKYSINGDDYNPIETYDDRELEEIANSFEGVDNCFAIQAGREVRIVVKPEIVDDEKMVLLAHDIAEKIEGELEYPGQIKVHLVRESRAVDYAK